MPPFDPQKLAQASTGNLQRQSTGCLSIVLILIQKRSFYFFRQTVPINIAMELHRFSLTPYPCMRTVDEITAKQSIIEVI